MFKKIVSYLIIFSILFSDGARCGTVLGRGSPEHLDDAEASHRLTIKRQSTQDPYSEDPGLGEGTPLIPPGQPDQDPTFIPPLPTNFQAVAQSISLNQFHMQGVSLTETEGEPTDASMVSSMQDTPGPVFVPSVQEGMQEALWPQDDNSSSLSTSEEDPITFKKSHLERDAQDLEHNVSNIPEGADRVLESNAANIPSITDVETGKGQETLPQSTETTTTSLKEHTDLSHQDSQEPLAILDSNNVDPQNNREPRSAAAIKRINTYNLQSWKQLTEVQKRSLTGGELTAFSGPPPGQLVISRPKPGVLNLQTPNLPDEGDEDIQDFITVSGDGPSTLSPETEEFLRYVKVRVVDGKLNWKQILGIFGGVVTGVGIAYPLGYIFFDAMFSVLLFFDVDVNGPIQSFLYPLPFLFGVSATLDTVSRTTSILIELMKDSVQPFTIQKIKAYQYSLLAFKGSMYLSAFCAGLLPAYYIFVHFYCPPPRCTAPLYWHVITWAGVSGLFIDTGLHYGHQLSHDGESWINGYLFHQMREGLLLSAADIKQQRYLQEFKGLKRMIYGLEEDDLNKLYADVFKQSMSSTAGESDKNIEETNIKDTLRILQVFNNFYRDSTNKLLAEEEENCKKTTASWMGWGITLLATVGRHLVFWYAVDEICEYLTFQVGISEGVRQALSIILGGIIAGLVQAVIEKDAIQETFYSVFCAKKVPDATSHYPLRIGIKGWDFLLGAALTLPYIVTGWKVLNERLSSPWPLWAQITTLVPFGLADILNNATAFHDSNLDILNGFDSAMSYCYAFEGYKRDKLIRMTRQLRRLFKELRPEVLEEVDKELNKNPKKLLLLDNSEPEAS